MRIARLLTTHALAEPLVRRPIRDGALELDPSLQLLLQLQRLSGEGGFETKGSVAAARAAYHELVGGFEAPAPAPAMSIDRALAGVRVRVHRPPGPGPFPALVYFHGGGFVVGDLDTHEHLARRFCLGAAAVVVAVDYRLAPEHPFPCGLDDCVAVTRAVLAEADALGVDPARVGLAGDSAGGNLALVVGQVVEGVRFQLLIYPTTNVTAETASKARFARGFGLDRRTVDWFTDHYLAGGTDPRDPRVSPLLSSELGRCPRTHVAAAGFDVLRDEGLALVTRLRELGVPTTQTLHERLIHGFVHLTRIPSCDAAVAELVEIARRGLDA